MANRLAGETSPYLLQHKDNPVDWYPWGDEALTRAKEEDRPILLSVGYSACHWCHVMEHESFEDADTAAYMNEHFVCIKVDREERPDVDALYMEAVQGMTGQGGWPMTVFLDPDAVPFYAGTYFPPKPRQGMPSFHQVMEAVEKGFREQREEISAGAERTREQLAAVARIQAPEGPLPAEALDDAVAGLRAAADMQRGGFGGAPKFPPSSALDFLLGAGVTDIVELTLDSMAAGGMHDQIGGGFARYSVDADWMVPHFEKMLYDNALLARAYLHGWQVIGHERYRSVCESTLDWALAEMRGPEGGFYSALDADSEGHEGRFYVWIPDEVREVLGDAAQPVLDWFGITEVGNFEGRSIPHLPAGAAAEPPSGLEQARRALYEARAKRVWPGLDDKRLTSWNALMISALAEAGAALGRAQYTEAAVACAEFVERELRDKDGRLLRTFKDGEARIPAYLEDHAFLVEALLTLYEATFDAQWFEAARRTADEMVERFGDDERGGFFTTAVDGEQLIARRKDFGDHPIPSGNASAALGLLRLSALTGDAGYAERALGVLKLLARAAAQHPDGFGHLLQALAFELGAVREVALAGDELDELASVVRAAYRPRVVLAGGPAGTSEPPLMRDRTPVDGRPAAYVCERFVCKAPVTAPGELETALGSPA